jgi:hypothetical protein
MLVQIQSLVPGCAMNALLVLSHDQPINVSACFVGADPTIDNGRRP